MEKKLKQGQQVFFVGEKLPMTVNSISDKFAVCTRSANYNVDRGFIKDYGSWSKVKNEKIYSVLDFTLNWKGPHNSWGYGIENQSDCDEALKALESGELEVSRRNKVPLQIDWKRTDPLLHFPL